MLVNIAKKFKFRATLNWFCWHQTVDEPSSNLGRHRLLLQNSTYGSKLGRPEASILCSGLQMLEVCQHFVRPQDLVPGVMEEEID